MTEATAWSKSFVVSLDVEIVSGKKIFLLCVSFSTSHHTCLCERIWIGEIEYLQLQTFFLDFQRPSKMYIVQMSNIASVEDSDREFIFLVRKQKVTQHAKDVHETCLRLSLETVRELSFAYRKTRRVEEYNLAQYVTPRGP